MHIRDERLFVPEDLCTLHSIPSKRPHPTSPLSHHERRRRRWSSMILHALCTRGEDAISTVSREEFSIANPISTPLLFPPTSFFLLPSTKELKCSPEKQISFSQIDTSLRRNARTYMHHCDITKTITITKESSSLSLLLLRLLLSLLFVTPFFDFFFVEDYQRCKRDVSLLH